MTLDEWEAQQRSKAAGTKMPLLAMQTSQMQCQLQCECDGQVMDPPQAMHCPAVCKTAAELFNISFPKALTLHQARLQVGIRRCCARIGNEQIL